MAANGAGGARPPPAGGGGLPVPDLRTMEELCQPSLDGRAAGGTCMKRRPVWKEYRLPRLYSTQMTLELANHDICTLKGIAIDVFVPVGKFTFPANFVIVDYESDPRVPLIFGRPFLRTAHALIDIHGEQMILRDDSKIFDDELDLPKSNNVLPFLECDSVFYEDFSKVDDLPSTNNEDKVFNLGILIHENLFEVTNFATPEKNVKKATNASLILGDFNPPLSLYELPFHKEVPGLGALLSFLSENEEKVYNHPDSELSKNFKPFFSQELISSGALKRSSHKILKVPYGDFVFPALTKKTPI
ncbi:reverse transcriptase domain-containing protein [Tanacetum coccineum]